MKREKYTEQMDKIHVPEEKAQETLRMMLAENRRLAEKEAGARAEKRTRFPAKPFGYVLAAAACLALVFFGVSMTHSGPAFHSVRMSSLPSLGGTRGDENKALSFAQAFGCAEGELFSGWEITNAQAEAIETNAGPLYAGRAEIEKDGKVLQAAVTDFEPPLAAFLKSEGKEMKNGMYLAKDDSANPALLLAVFEKDGLYIVLSGQDMAENVFLNAAEALR